MSTQSQAFSLGREGGEDGSFQRQESTFRNFVSANGSTGFPLQRDRYHLYVTRACPWAHRTVIGRRLMGLEHAIGVSFVNPLRDDRGWAFAGDGYTDSVNGFHYLSEAYAASDAAYQARVSVPVLWDNRQATIVCNESEDLLRMLGTVFAELAEHPVVLYPEPLETDWRLFTTLVRFDAIYQIHFKCSVRKLVEYEHLWPYARDLYQWPGVAETVDFDEIRAHYYGTHPMINPSGLIAVQPAASFDEPAGRDSLG